jgi:hypothetical protein
MGGTEGNASDASSVPFLRIVKGDATPEEVAALTAVLQGLAAAAASSGETPKPRSEWSAHHRKTRPTFPSGPGGWRSSAMPR